MSPDEGGDDEEEEEAVELHTLYRLDGPPKTSE